MKNDIGTIDELMRVLETENLTELSYECTGFKINLKRPYKVAPAKKTTQKKEDLKKVKDAEYIELLSQGIGRFYSAKKGAESKLVQGALVKKGDEVGHIITMGVKNIVISDVDGIIEEVYIADGEVVDFDRAILKLKK